MRFKNWFETLHGKLIDKSGQGFQVPQKSLNYHQGMVNDFVENMTNPAENERFIIKLLKESIKTIVYDKRIGAFFEVKPSNTKKTLGQVYGIITNLNPFFHFKPTESSELVQGNIEIAIPPCNYDAEDKAILESILIHELQHAQDWMDPYLGKKVKPLRIRDKTNMSEEDYKFNQTLYLNKLSETRAWGRQLDTLLKRLKDPHKVLDALKNSRIQTQHPLTIEFVKKFLQINEVTSPPWSTPAMVQSLEKQDVLGAIELLGKISENYKFLLRFRNFVSYS